MTEQHEGSVKLGDYLRIILRGRWIILLCFLVVLGTTTFFTYRMEPVYQASTSIMIEDKGRLEQSVFGFSNLLASQTTIANQVEVIKSRTLAERVIHALEASQYRDNLKIMADYDRHDRPVNFNGKVKLLRESITVEPVKETDIIVLKVTANSAFESAYLANEIARQFFGQNLEYSKGEVGEVRRFLESQLDSVRMKLSESEEQLKLYKESHKLVALDEETEKLVEQTATFRAHLNEAEAELQENVLALQDLRNKFAESKSTLVEDVSRISSPLITELQTRIAEKQALIANLIAKSSPGYEIVVKDVEREIDEAKKALIEEAHKIANSGISSIDPLKTSQELFDQILRADINIKSLTARTEALGTVVNSYESQLEALPEKNLELVRLMRDAELNEKIFLMRSEKYEESRIAEAGKTANVRIIDPAVPPPKPIRPNRQLNVFLAIFFGLGLGVAISFAIELLDGSVRTVEDLEKLKVSVLGAIPTIDPEEIARRMKRHGHKLSPEDRARLTSKLITNFSPKSPVSEAYRSLRTNILFANLDRQAKTLVVSSSATKEGKSTTVANLAITMAQMGSRVLIVDADLRRPTMHTLFKIERQIGLSNALLGNYTLDEVIKPTGIENLDIITAGDIPPNPSELLSSNAMRKTLALLQQRYDMILLDSPPVIAVTDAAVLSTRTDAVLLVVSSGYVTRKEVDRAIQLLGNVRANLIGVLLNGLDVKRIYGSYYYYYHYYQYYYYYGTKKQRRTSREADLALEDNGPREHQQTG
ncbi:MAG: polysaccharide biosynthesis tyrosine autokinase [Candidatus Zixiibacteriota bacterium]|nr:MAG: polysaccharide biosynthesis tyrosine autokinase [candidate division Zixibacteria bacterium]